MGKERVFKEMDGRKYNIPFPFKGIMAVMLSVSLILSPGLSRKVYAMENESELRQSVEEATRLLETILKKQYRKKEQELKDLIMDKGYQYDLTMTSFYDIGNPFKDMDYIDILSVYSSIREYCNLNGLLLGEGLGGVDFLTMEVREMSYKSDKALLYPAYEAVPEGYFVRSGNHVVTEDTEVDAYEEYEPGRFRYAGKEKITIRSETVHYGEVSLSVIAPDELYDVFQVDKKDIIDSYHKRKAAIEREVNEDALSQSVFVQVRYSADKVSDLSASDIERLIADAPSDRQALLRTSVSLLGQVPYEWGGKPRKSGYDNNWWLYIDGVQNGLDCSGFVQWAFMTSGYDKTLTDKMISTSTMISSLEDISPTDLLPGDIGLLNLGDTINHAGIYLGDGYFIHCSSAAGTVAISKFDFHYFKRAVDENSMVDIETQKTYDIDNYTKSKYYTNIHQQEILMLAQLIEHEAGNQGLNGWVAVGEVVINRLNSPDFPDTVSGVIFQKGQFTNASAITGIEPREEILSVSADLLYGNIRIFNNPSVLYFRNPMLTSGIAASTPADWGNHKWYASLNEHAFYLSN